MKTIITILISIAIITLITGCNSQEQSTTAVVLLHDITDIHIAQPDTQEILSLFDLQNKWNGGIFQFKELTDVSYNQIKQAKLEPQNKWLANEFDREKEIKKFTNEVVKIIKNRSRYNAEKANSAIYFPIANELNKLKNIKAQRHILVVYSNLMENAPDLSFYKRDDFEKLKSNPEQIIRIFEKQETLETLNGIEVYFIYQPTENISDQKFQIISGFYKKLLEDKGAKVNISANL
ncbi:MAG: hypothetical protein HY951_00720 [Bacteroidia bacterium]|nr:hypothetical protein [Bacteroidia bacterium]